MIKRNLFFAAAFIISAQMAAALTADELAAQYQADGYGYISIRTGVTQLKITAVKDGKKVEIIYDAATGAVLKSESRAIGTRLTPDNGPNLRTVNRDFVRTTKDDHSADADKDHDSADEDNDDHQAVDDNRDDHDHADNATSDDDSADDKSDDDSANDSSDDDHGHDGGKSHDGDND